MICYYLTKTIAAALFSTFQTSIPSLAATDLVAVLDSCFSWCLPLDFQLHNLWRAVFHLAPNRTEPVDRFPADPAAHQTFYAASISTLTASCPRPPAHTNRNADLWRSTLVENLSAEAVRGGRVAMD